MKNPPQVILRRIFLLVTCDRGWVGLKLSFSRRRVAEGWFVPSFLSDTPGPTVCATGHRGGLFRGTTRLAHPVRVCETSCFAEFIVRQNARHPASRFAFLLIAHPWALRPSTLPPFCPFPPCILRVSSADGALPSADSSPNAISLDLSLGQCSLRSNTVWPRNRQVKARYRTQASIRQWD